MEGAARTCGVTSPAILSASAQLVAATGDQEAKAKADEMVAGMAKCQARLGGGYLSAFPLELFDRLDALSGKPRNPDGLVPDRLHESDRNG